MLRSATLASFVFLLLPIQPVHAQSVHGRVVDEGTGRPVRDVSVMIVSSSDGSILTGTMSDGSGRYSLDTPGAGTYELVTDLIGYEGERRPLVVREQDVTMPDIGLTQVSLTMVGLEVTATRDLASHPSGRGISVILDRAILRGLERSGQSLSEAIVEHLNVRSRTVAGEPCMEYLTGNPAAGPCRGVIVVVDGRVDPAGPSAVARYSLADLESVEIVPPGLAIEQYASRDAANGALVLWSRGLGPHAK